MEIEKKTLPFQEPTRSRQVNLKNILHRNILVIFLKSFHWNIIENNFCIHQEIHAFICSNDSFHSLKPYRIKIQCCMKFEKIMLSLVETAETEKNSIKHKTYIKSEIKVYGKISVY